jgi:hypothetical protein
MSPKAAEVMEQAWQLTEDERRELAIELLDSAVEPEIEAAWTEEARRRAGTMLARHLAPSVTRMQ